MRGDGRVFKRGSTWWVAWSEGGRERRESSGSTSRADAVRLLRRRTAEAEVRSPCPTCGRSEDRGEAEVPALLMRTIGMLLTPGGRGKLRRALIGAAVSAGTDLETKGRETGDRVARAMARRRGRPRREASGEDLSAEVDALLATDDGRQSLRAALAGIRRAWPADLEVKSRPVGQRPAAPARSGTSR